MNILNTIYQAGLCISLVGENIKVSNPSCLTDDLRNLIRSNKADIVTQLLKTQATHTIKVYCYRVTDKPKSELTLITHGETLEEVREGLLMRYGSGLLSVYPSPYCMAGLLTNESNN